jgi:hypothetical protein
MNDIVYNTKPKIINTVDESSCGNCPDDDDDECIVAFIVASIILSSSILYSNSTFNFLFCMRRCPTLSLSLSLVLCLLLRVRVWCVRERESVCVLCLLYCGWVGVMLKCSRRAYLQSSLSQYLFCHSTL